MSHGIFSMVSRQRGNEACCHYQGSMDARVTWVPTQALKTPPLRAAQPQAVPRP